VLCCFHHYLFHLMPVFIYIQLDVNEHWHKMKKIMMETAQHVCGMSKGPRRHKETCWCNEEIAEAVREKKIKYRKWKTENLK